MPRSKRTTTRSPKSRTPTPAKQSLFQLKIQDIDVYMKAHDESHHYLIEALGSHRIAECQELDLLDHQMQQGATELKAKLAQPRLLIAIAGTTSSAKSTTINLLCGADLMPMDVGEMSAGVVIIRSSPTACLAIEQTPGAPWDCGVFLNLDAQEIRTRLKEVMSQFHELCESGSDNIPAAPRAIVEYPLRDDLRELLGVPANIELELRDLPGIKSLSDETNRRELKNCEEALILLAFDANETNRERQKHLLSELVTLIEELGGSPHRFFFFASRIDYYRQNHSDEWPENEDKFVDSLWTRIKTQITSRQGSFTEALDSMRLYRLSPKPACLAYKMRDEVCTDDRFLRILKGYSFLVDEDFPRPSSDSFHNQWNIFAEKLDEGAQTASFFAGLKAHIQSQIFELIISPILGTFARDCIAPYELVSTQIIRSQIDASEDRYETAVQDLDDAKKKLISMLQEKEKTFKTPFDDFSDAMQESAMNPKSDHNKFFDKLMDDVQKISYLKDNIKDYYAFFRWERNIKRSVDDLMLYCMNALKLGVNTPPPPDAVVLPRNLFYEFKITCEKLRSAGYESFPAGGKTFTKEEDLGTIENLNRALDAFAEAVTNWINHLLFDQAIKQQKFAYKALELISEKHGNIVTSEALLISPHIGFETLILKSKSRTEIKLSKLGPLINQTTQKIKTKYESHEEKYTESVPVKILWWTLWTRQVERKRIIYTNRQITEVSFPGIEDIKKLYFSDQIYSHINNICREFADQLSEIISSFTESIENSHRDLFEQYRLRLEDARTAVTIDRDNNISLWTKANELSESARSHCYNSVLNIQKKQKQ